MTDQAITTTSSSTDPPPPPLLLPNLPDDVALQCIARVPRSHHPILSLVSKSWKSAISSSVFFTARCLLRCTQHFLYLNVRINNDFTWYTLNQSPNRNHPNPNYLSTLPSIPFPFQPRGASFVSLGPKIYVIGGAINHNPSNCVWVFDCRFNRWEIGPKMRVGREFAAAGVVNGKIYVIGGCVVDNWARSMNWAELFDPVSEVWTAVPSPIEIRDKWMHATAVIDSKMYAMADRGGVVYDVRERKWGGVSKRLDLGWRGRAAVVGGVLYCYDYLGKIRGYDVDKDVWKELKGVEKCLPKFLCGATMANLGGKLCVVWEGKGNGKEVEIMCAEIEVWKDEYGGLNGSVLWCDMIIAVPPRSSIVHCLAVAL